MRPLDAASLARLRFAEADGLLPVIAQDARTGEVLMLGFADRAALERSLATGELWFFSRSRGRLWKKGETSGNVLRVVGLHADCDDDAVLARVRPVGPACHTGERSCFGAPPTLASLEDVLAARAAELPERSYTTRLLRDRNHRLKKLGEEAAELAVACADRVKPRIAAEAADLLYHTLVACRAEGVSLGDVLAELDARAG